MNLNTVLEAEPESSRHYGDVRGFTQLSKAWYGKYILTEPDILDSIMIGFYASKGGTSGEFEILWEKLNDKFIPRLKAFNDGWSALSNFGDLLESMADIDGKDVTPDEFASLLESLGIENMTKTEREANGVLNLAARRETINKDDIMRLGNNT